MRPRLGDRFDGSKFYSLDDVSKIESTFLFMEAVPFTQGSNTLWIEDDDTYSKIQITSHESEAAKTSFHWNDADGDFIEQIDLHLAVRRGLSITLMDIERLWAGH
ncbi:MAG: hypothetical protein LQ346_001811 [Caloplaca aetnensis]|nr:MAG: hypothetical protein LQ346_001811 [Caloplaca aetnensis]